MEKKHGTPCGEEEDCSKYKVKDTRPACLQLAHLMRSIFWSPSHLKAKKVKETINARSQPAAIHPK